MILFRSFAILLGALLPMVCDKPANPWGTRCAAAFRMMQTSGDNFKMTMRQTAEMVVSYSKSFKA